jgi:hypothetical protein
MKVLIGCTVFIIISATLLKAQPQLSPPVLSVSRAFINSEAILSMDFRMKGTKIHYTTDGSKPNTSSLLYKTPLRIKDAVVINAKTFHKNFSPSESTTAQFYTIPKIILQITGTLPDPNYPGDGFKTLTNHILGDDNFRKNYLGYNTDEITLDVTNTKNDTIQTLHLSDLVNQGAWIFSPSKIEILINNEVVTVYTSDNCLKPADLGYTVLKIPIVRNLMQNFKVKIYPVKSLPEWHGGKGNKGWVFLDEVWVE